MTNDSKGTYHSIGQFELEPRGGRYSALKVDEVNAMLQGRIKGPPSPWLNDPPEPPLGYSVDAQEPVGEAFEIRAPQSGVESEISRVTRADNARVVPRKR